MIQRNKKHFWIAMIVGFVVGAFIYSGKGFIGTLLLSPLSGIVLFIVVLGIGCGLVDMLLLTKKPFDFSEVSNPRIIWSFNVGMLIAIIIFSFILS